MRYGSVCSGIEAATAAWHHLGWEPAFFSEIEAFPRAVLEHHYPEVPLHGDFTTIEKNQYGKIDLLVGGTPCQSFSVAGLRGGLDDERGNLALEFCRLAQREQPRWIVWENVPGVLSSNGGRDFGSILGALAQLGYGLAYRVLDAQYFGVAQRRRRVFVVGYLGDWRRAAAVLFERHSLSGHPAPRREKREDITHSTAPCLTSSGRGVERTGDTRGQDPVVAVGGRDGPLVDWPSDVACTLDTDFASKWGQNNQHVNAGCPLFVPAMASSKGEPATRRQDFEVETFAIQAGALRTNPNSGPDGVGVQAGHAYTLEARAEVQAVAFTQNTRDEVRYIGGDGGDKPHAMVGMQVRRLTPRECERLQGFPDGYTAIPWRKKPADECPDGPRYKALGNSMAVPVMRWIGERIQMVEDMTSVL